MVALICVVVIGLGAWSVVQGVGLIAWALLQLLRGE